MKSTTQSGLWKVEFGELGATLKVLQDHGVTPDHLARLRAEPDYAKRVAAFMLRGGLDASIHQKLARAVIGKNFFGVEDWSALYGVNFNQKQLRQVAEFPWSEDVLNSPCPFNKGKLVKDTHFAFLGLSRINGAPLTVVKWLELHPATGQPKFHFDTDPWHTGQPHTDVATMQLRWYLLLKDIVPDSTEKTPEEQSAMLPPEYEVPSTIAEVTKDILTFRKTGVHPNPSRWAACAERTVKTDKVSAGLVSCVSSFGERGLDVDRWSGYRLDCVGLGASRKF